MIFKSSMITQKQFFQSSKELFQKLFVGSVKLDSSMSLNISFKISRILRACFLEKTGTVVVMSSRVNNLWQFATQSETSSFEKPWQYPNALQEWLSCNSQRAAFKILLSSSLTFLHLVGTIVDRADFLSNGLTDSVQPFEPLQTQETAQKLQQS